MAAAVTILISQYGHWQPFSMTENHFRISRHFKSIRNFSFFWNYFTKWPFWITENHCQSHFSPFQINTQVFKIFFSQNACHFVSPKITFDRISRHFRSIRNFHFCWHFFTRWPATSGQKSLSIAFLTISDQYTTFIFVDIIFTKWPPAAILDDRKSRLQIYNTHNLYIFGPILEDSQGNANFIY